MSWMHLIFVFPFGSLCGWRSGGGACVSVHPREPSCAQRWNGKRPPRRVHHAATGGVRGRHSAGTVWGTNHYVNQHIWSHSLLIKHHSLNPVLLTARPWHANMTTQLCAWDNTTLFFSFPQQLYRKKPGMTMNASRHADNIVKNRYRDISPCEYSSCRSNP